jgi:hypothetical protein
VPGGEGVLSIPCGVITHAGTHSLTISYTNTTVIASTQFWVAWPVMAVTVPHRMETFTMDVVVRVSFTKNLCTPLPTSGNNNNQRVLQGGENGLMPAWLRVEKCETNACDDSKVMHMARVENFYSSHSSKVIIKCSEWGVAGIFRVIIDAEMISSRHVESTLLMSMIVLSPGAKCSLLIGALSMSLAPTEWQLSRVRRGTAWWWR